MQLPLTGGCQCGKVRYEITHEPSLVYACDCADCQRITSSAFSLGIALPQAAFRLTSGELNAFLTVVGSTPGSSARIALAGYTASRAVACSAVAQIAWTTDRGCDRHGIYGLVASSPGSPSPMATRYSRDSRPNETGLGLADRPARLHSSARSTDRLRLAEVSEHCRCEPRVAGPALGTSGRYLIP